MNYNFSLKIDNPIIDDDAAAKKLSIIGCNDGVIGKSNNIYEIEFKREAQNLNEAVSSAVQDLEKANFKLLFDILPTNKQHISFSELSNWNDCSWSHWKKQIDKIDFYIDNVHALFGTAVHAANEDFLKTQSMKIDIALDMIDESWEKARLNPPKHLNDEQTKKFLDSFTKDDIRNEKGKVIVQSQSIWKKQAQFILTEIPLFMENTFPKWEFVDAEHYLYEDINDLNFNLNYAFKGYIDGVIKAPNKHGKMLIHLIDWKTSTRGWFKEKKRNPFTKLQIILYKHFWCQKNLDINPKDVRCAFAILKRLGKSGQLCDYFPVSAGPVTIERGRKAIANMIVSLNKGIKIKNRTSCKYCDYFGTEHCDSIFRTI